MLGGVEITATTLAHAREMLDGVTPGTVVDWPTGPDAEAALDGELARADGVLESARVLSAACGTVGAPQVRARGTIGGNVANASPAADGVVALLALDAAVLVVSAAYLHIMFISHRPEYRRTYPEHRVRLFWVPYGDNMPTKGLFGFPYRAGWKVVGSLYAQGILQGDYSSNEESHITGWYLRSQRFYREGIVMHVAHVVVTPLLALVAVLLISLVTLSVTLAGSNELTLDLSDPRILVAVSFALGTTPWPLWRFVENAGKRIAGQLN